MKNYKNSSLMIKFNPTIDQQIMSFANTMIPVECQSDPENGSGIVTDPHISLITDLQITHPDLELKKIISKIPSFDVSFGSISFFRNDVDVIKIDIESDQLTEIHYNLKSLIPNQYRFDEYHPHCTLAFVKSGSCDNILDHANFFRGMVFRVEWINFNTAKGVTHPFKINNLF